MEKSDASTNAKKREEKLTQTKRHTHTPETKICRAAARPNSQASGKQKEQPDKGQNSEKK